MREEPIHVVRREMVFLTQLQKEIDTQRNDKLREQPRILLKCEKRLCQPLLFRIVSPPLQTAVSLLFSSSIHTGFLAAGKRCNINPIHTKRQVVFAWSGLKQQGKRPIRQHPPQEFFLESQHGLVLQQGKLLRLLLEIR